jgi:glycosyltransferase involved in cell wall biosynthesis
MIVLHRLLRTWKRTVTTFIAISEFTRQKFVEQGFPDSRTVVKAPFVLDPGPPGGGGDDFLFVGRLSVEKGVRTMLAAMELVPPAIRLKIVGDGPLAGEVRAAAERNARIQYLGRVPQRQVLESFSKGTPVIASRIGAVAKIVDNGRTGFHYRSGDSKDLARVIGDVVARGDELVGMRTEARLEFERNYTADRNYQILMGIYENAIANRRGPRDRNA